jgi:peptidoglycan/xylan/chitin deacetylase (PgdA/CDA1 family)
MKKLLFAFILALGITRLVSWCNRRRVTILCYHSVTERVIDVAHDDPHKQHLSRNLFISQIDYLRRHYRIISLREYLSAVREKRRLPNHSVVLTFDDGIRNFLTVVAPILAKRAIPATIFIVTDKASQRGNSALDSRWTPDDDETYLSWDEVAKIEREYNIEIGSHTCSHSPLLEIPTEEVMRELNESHAAIVAHLQHDSLPLAYPYGEGSVWLSEQARSLGYTCALTGDLGTNDPDSNLHLLYRTVIAADDDLTTFAARVSGVTWWFNEIRMRLKLRAKRRTGQPASEYNRSMLNQIDT